jgi:cell division cycle 2-like protein
MTSSEESSSTPGKRSRWDSEPYEDAYDHPATHYKKTKHRAKENVPMQPAPSVSPVFGMEEAVARPTHSFYVPPRTEHPALAPSRSVYSYERLNQIEEGSYGVVFRARDKQTGDIVALKKLKLEEEKNGFPITALREINALVACRHDHVVNVREVVVGDTLTQCVSSLTRTLSHLYDTSVGQIEECLSSWTLSSMT